MQSLSIKICNSVEEAPIYPPEIKPATLSEVVIVRKGTTAGRTTVDLVFTDKDGNKSIAMITGRLLKNAADMIGEE